MTSKEELLQNIVPGTDMTKDIAYMIYGYDISYPGFMEQALAVFDSIGNEQAWTQYNNIVTEYEQQHIAAMKAIADRLYIHQPTGGGEQRNGQRTEHKRKRREYRQF